MTYHDNSLSLLRLSPEGTASIAGLPAAVGDWFARPDSVTILKTYSNQDSPVEPRDFRVVSEAGHKFTVFMYENQD